MSCPGAQKSDQVASILGGLSGGAHFLHLCDSPSIAAAEQPWVSTVGALFASESTQLENKMGLTARGDAGTTMSVTWSCAACGRCHVFDTPTPRPTACMLCTSSALYDNSPMITDGKPDSNRGIGGSAAAETGAMSGSPYPLPTF